MYCTVTQFQKQNLKYAHILLLFLTHSLWLSVLNYLPDLSEGTSFIFLVRFCHPVHLVLSLLGSQSYLGYCYLKAEPFFFLLVLSPLCIEYYLGCCYLKVESFLFFFLLVPSLLGSQSYLGCCYLKKEPLLFFHLVCLTWVVCFIWAVVI